MRQLNKNIKLNIRLLNKNIKLIYNIDRTGNNEFVAGH